MNYVWAGAFRNVAKFSFQGQFSKIFLFDLFRENGSIRRFVFFVDWGCILANYFFCLVDFAETSNFGLKLWSKKTKQNFWNFFCSKFCKSFNQFLRSCKILLLTLCCFWIRLMNRFRSISPFGTAELSWARGFVGMKKLKNLENGRR